MVKTKVVDLGKIYALFSTEFGEIIDCLVNLGTWFSLYGFHL